MNVLLENKSAKIWVDENAPIVFCRLLFVPDDRRKYQELCDVNIKAIAQVRSRTKVPIYSLCDASQLKPFPFEIFLRHYVKHLPAQFHAGLKFKAIVRPIDIFSDWSLPDFLHGETIGIFDCFSSALGCINTKWANLLTS